MSTHSLFTNFQIYIFDWKITNSKTWYVKIILYTCFLRIYMHVNVHTYHIQEFFYHSLSGLYSIIFGQINYAIISANTPYSVPLLLYKANIFIGIKFMISSLYNITYYMSILILCFPDLNNSFSILCYFSIYALYNMFNNTIVEYQILWQLDYYMQIFPITSVLFVSIITPYSLKICFDI